MAVALLLLLAGVLLLPFLPALHEAYRQRDSLPLALADRYREDLRHGTATGAPVLAHELLDAERAHEAAGELAVDALLPTRALVLDRVRVRGMARLPAGSVVQRRLAVGAAAEIGDGTVLAGSAEAGDMLWLGAGCAFERLHAPLICTGVPGGDGAAPPVRDALAPTVLIPGAQVAGGRTLVRGNLDLPPGAAFQGDLVVTGALTLGAGARVRGSAKAHRGLHLKDGAVVMGNAVSGADLALASGAVVGGAAVAAERLDLGEGARVGRLTAPSTATGREVRMAADVTVHGTLWAREAGHTV